MATDRRWTREDVETVVQALKTAPPGSTVENVAEGLGITRSALKHMLERFGFPRASSLIPHKPVLHGLHNIQAPARAPARAPAISTTLAAPPDVERQHFKDEVLRRLVQFCQQRPRSLAEVCDHLNMAPVHARRTVETARAAGYPLELSGDGLAWKDPAVEVQSAGQRFVARVPAIGERYSVGLMSDTHFGNRWTRRELIRDCINWAVDEGATAILHCGDMLDGVAEWLRWEQDCHGWDAQAADAHEVLPKSLPWFGWVDGNHDHYHTRAIGMESGQRLEEYFRARGRKDVHYLGTHRRVVDLEFSGAPRPVRFELRHYPNGRGGRTYAKSYPLQNAIRDMHDSHHEPDVLACGHLHTFAHVPQHGIEALLLPCFQGPESAYGQSLGGSVVLGMVLFSVRLDERGAIVEADVRRRIHRIGLNVAHVRPTVEASL